MESVTLQGKHVRLEPLGTSHIPGLAEVGLDPELWRWTNIAVLDAAGMQDFVAAALQAPATIPFATIEQAANRVVGSTRYMNIDTANRRLEIGTTWIAPAWQRTAINTEAKFLMLEHAFEKLDCIRVELKTDALNDKSRRAILRLGAKEEGTLRSHMICHNGRIRDTVYYSILASEWPSVKSRLANC